MLERKQGSLGRIHAVTPLDHHGALIKELLQSEVDKLGPDLEAVEVDMRNLNAAGVDANQLKGWACDMCGRPDATRESPDESCLACAKVAFEQNKVALSQPRSELLTCRFGFRWSVGDDVKQSGRSRSRAAAAAFHRYQPP